jgi:hypothetical protein
VWHSQFIVYTIVLVSCFISVFLPQVRADQKKLVFSTNASLTSLTYKQNNVPDFSQNSLMVNGAADYSIDQFWTLFANSSFTFVPFSPSKPQLSMRFFDLSIKASYKLIPKFKYWHMEIAGGLFYTTTLTNEKDIGYTNVFALQLNPILVKTFESGRSAWAFLKYSPNLDLFSPLNLNNAQLAFGGGFAFAPAMNGSIFSIFAEMSTLKIESGQNTFQTTSYAAGVGYRF